MKILVPVDGSPAADHAIEALLAYVPQLKESPQIVLFHASLPVRPALALHGVAAEKEAIEAHHRKEGEIALTPARAHLQAAGLSHGELAVQGEAAEEICRVAQENGCDMIWMGTRGMGSFANLILGSVATKVLHRSKVPVVMVPMHPDKVPLIVGSDFRT